MGGSVGGAASLAGGGTAARYLAILKRTREVLLQTVRGLSPEEMAWRPDEGINAVCNHLVHLAREEETLVGRVLLGRSLHRDRRREFSEHPCRDPSSCLRDLRAVRAVTQEWLAGADDSLMTRPLPRGSGLEGWTPCELLDYLIRHEVHHRAQILLLLKLIDPARSFPPLP